eukprot:scaffold254465_cov22-Tisochrysis_lutea.AAC.1
MTNPLLAGLDFSFSVVTNLSSCAGPGECSKPELNVTSLTSCDKPQLMCRALFPAEPQVSLASHSAGASLLRTDQMLALDPHGSACTLFNWPNTIVASTTHANAMCMAQLSATAAQAQGIESTLQ